VNRLLKPVIAADDAGSVLDEVEHGKMWVRRNASHPTNLPTEKLGEFRLIAELNLTRAVGCQTQAQGIGSVVLLAVKDELDFDFATVVNVGRPVEEPEGSILLIGQHRSPMEGAGLELT
jgi:hypothetical protein